MKTRPIKVTMNYKKGVQIPDNIFFKRFKKGIFDVKVLINCENICG